MPRQGPMATCKVKSKRFAARSRSTFVGIRLNIKWEWPSSNSTIALESGENWKAEYKKQFTPKSHISVFRISMML